MKRPRGCQGHSVIRKCVPSAKHVPGGVVTELALDVSLKQSHVRTMASICRCVSSATQQHAADKCVRPETSWHCSILLRTCGTSLHSGESYGHFVLWKFPNIYTSSKNEENTPHPLHSASTINGCQSGFVCPIPAPPHSPSCLSGKKSPVTMMSESVCHTKPEKRELCKSQLLF